jgi:hypothetical protein
MKKLSALFIAGFALLVISCQKGNDCKPHDSKETQTINATLDKNTTYTFTIPANTKSNAYEISTQAVHASTSKLTTDASNTVYTFTPVIDYVGTDKVIISAAEQNHSGNNSCGSNHPPKDNGACGQQQNKTSIQYIINLTVNDVVAVNKKTITSVTITPVF